MERTERITNEFFCTAEEAYEKGAIINIDENTISVDFSKIKVCNENYGADPWDYYTYGTRFLDLSDMTNLKEVHIADIYGLPKYFLILPSMNVKFTNWSRVIPCVWENDAFLVGGHHSLFGVFPKTRKVTLPHHIKNIHCGNESNGFHSWFRFIPDDVEIEYDEENLSSIEDKYFKDHYLHRPFCKK